MKTVNFTSTVELSTVTTLCIEKATRKPVERQIELIGKFTVENAEKPVKKLLASDATVAFAMVLNVEVKSVLASVPLDIFTARAKKLTRRGEDGRTREPVITRTVELSTVTTLCIERATRKPVERQIELNGNFTEDEAEKPVKKLLASDATVAFAMVLKVNVETSVYEMFVREFITLARTYGEIKEAK